MCDISSKSRSKYHLTVKLFAWNLRNFTCNFARKFARTKNEIHWNSFALLLHNTVDHVRRENKSTLTYNGWCYFRVQLLITPWTTTTIVWGFNPFLSEFSQILFTFWHCDRKVFVSCKLSFFYLMVCTSYHEV